MKKLLFILPTFGIGGTTVSTRNLLSVIDKKDYDITVWCLDGKGILKGIYDDVPQLKTSFVARALSIRSWRTEKGILKCIAAAIRFSKHIPLLYNFFLNFSIKKSVQEYRFDTVIACQEGLTSLLASLVPASNHVAWVRCDYKRYFKSHGFKKELFYKFFQHIVCVSEQTTKNFVEIHPEWKDKTLCIYNPQDSAMIRSQASINDNDARFCKDKNVIVSLGRLSTVKRFKYIPPIAQKLKEQGLEFIWYIVGDGIEREIIENNISEYNVSDCVIMLGAKSNPHFYISNADLYVCLSSTEACPRVVNEAKILGTPVVSTDFPTIYEYIEDKVNGRIVPIDDMAQAIGELLTNKDLYERIKSNISSFHFDNRELVKQLENIL